jgi:hypothetical protein
MNDLDLAPQDWVALLDKAARYALDLHRGQAAQRQSARANAKPRATWRRP